MATITLRELKTMLAGEDPEMIYALHGEQMTPDCRQYLDHYQAVSKSLYHLADLGLDEMTVDDLFPETPLEKMSQAELKQALGKESPKNLIRDQHARFDNESWRYLADFETVSLNMGRIPEMELDDIDMSELFPKDETRSTRNPFPIFALVASFLLGVALTLVTGNLFQERPAPSLTKSKDTNQSLIAGLTRDPELILHVTADRPEATWLLDDPQVIAIFRHHTANDNLKLRFYLVRAHHLAQIKPSADATARLRETLSWYDGLPEKIRQAHPEQAARMEAIRETALEKP